MAKSTLMKVVAAVTISSVLALSLAGGVAVGKVITTNEKNANQQKNGEDKPVQKVEKTNSFGYLDEYTITYEDGTTSTFIVTKGQDGKPQPSVLPGRDGTIPTVVVGENGNWIVNGGDSGVLAQAPEGIPSGQNDRSIVSVIKTGTEGLVDTYTITYSDNTTSAFTVTNGADGEQGIQGVKGNDGHTPVVTIENGYWVVDGVPTTTLAQGPKGDQGVGVVSITEIDDGDNNEKTHKYEIALSNGEFSYFVVTDGSQGEQGIQGVQGDDGHTPVVTIEDGYWVVDGVPTTTYAQGPKGDQGDPGQNGENGKSVLTGNGAPAADLGVEGDTYLDLDSLNLYVKDDTGWGNPVNNIKGATGATGVSITSVSINADGDLIVTFSDESTVNAGNVKTTTTHTVTFDSDGGSNVDAMENIAHGTTITAPTEPTKEGYIFQGWYVDGVVWNFNGDQVTDDITLYARWGQFEESQGYLVRATATGDVVIPTHVNGNAVEYISAEVFDDDCKAQVTSITIPSTIKEIETDAFKGLANLKNVYLNNGLQTIGETAFKNCSSLESIDVPATVKTIGLGAFEGCTSLKSMVLPFAGESDTTYTNGYLGYIFGATNENVNDTYVPNSLESVALQEGCSHVGRCAFSKTNIKYVVMPDSVTSLYNSAFRDCANLKTVVFNQSSKLTTIGALAFDGCGSLEAFEIPQSVYDLGNYSFAETGLTSIVVPTNVSHIVTGAFFGCNRLQSITINTVTTHANENTFNHFAYLFAGASTDTIDQVRAAVPASLKTIIISEGCTEIPAEAFSGLNKIENIVFPKSVTSVGFGALYNCNSLKSLTMPFVPGNGTDPAYLAYVFGGTTDYHKNIDYVPASLKTVVITGDDDVPENAFNNCWYVEEIRLEGRPTTIGAGAFTYCYSLRSFTIPNSVTTIGDYAFGACDSLESIDIPNSVTTLGHSVFYGCCSLTNVRLSDNLHDIPASTFENCEALTSVQTHIFNRIETIGEKAFKGCYSLNYYNFTTSVVSIGDSAFENCSSLTYVNLSDSVTEIGAGAFKGCTSLVVVHLPALLETIKDNCFEDCLSLITINLQDCTSLKLCGVAAFRNCKSLLSMTLPTSTDYTEIAVELFNGCSSLTYVYIPDNIATIKNGSFNNCSSLKSLVVPDSARNGIKTIGDVPGIAYGCTSLESLTVPSLTRDNMITYFCGFFGCHNILDNIGEYVPASLKTIVVTNPSSIIAEYAFRGFSNVETIIIQGYVEKLYGSTFRDCRSLKNVVLPDSITFMSDSTFRNCSSLVSVTLPSSLERFDNSGFEGCTSLRSVIIPSSVTKLSYAIFKDCTSLESITIPFIGADKVNTWDWSLANFFDYPSDTTAADVPASLKNVTITVGNVDGDSNIIIPANAFKGCSYIESIVCTCAVKKVGDSAFENCRSLTYVDINNVATDIGAYAFKNCSSLASITLPNPVQTMGVSIFEGCSSLAYFSVPTGHIGLTLPEKAFKDCTSLRGIIIKSNVSTIEKDILNGCNSLETMQVPFFGNIETWHPDNADEHRLSYWFDSTDTSSVPSSLKSIYCPYGNMSNGDWIIPEYAFAYCESLESITFWGDVNDSLYRDVIIGKYAFYQCYNLKTVFNTLNELPANLKTIGAEAFNYCRSLAVIDAAKSTTLQTIDIYAFAHCLSLVSFYIPDSVTGIRDSVFVGCRSLAAVRLHSNIAHIVSNAFDGTALRTVLWNNLDGSAYTTDRTGYDNWVAATVDSTSTLATNLKSDHMSVTVA